MADDPRIQTIREVLDTGEGADVSDWRAAHASLASLAADLAAAEARATEAEQARDRYANDYHECVIERTLVEEQRDAAVARANTLAAQAICARSTLDWLKGYCETADLSWPHSQVVEEKIDEACAALGEARDD